ncbi:MAG: DUF3040 domain-containing protein [Actinomycetota bacterium]|nr:DUF3040 domain-containing protein [Actinomycetota bacterium]
MALDDREQRILEEIERQFYEDDPKLAETVRTTTLAAISARQLKWAILALVAGVGIMLGFFTLSTPVALVGFVVMVLAVAWILAIVQRRTGRGMGASSAILARLRRRGGDG